MGRDIAWLWIAKAKDCQPLFKISTSSLRVQSGALMEIARTVGTTQRQRLDII